MSQLVRALGAHAGDWRSVASTYMMARAGTISCALCNRCISAPRRDLSISPLWHCCFYEALPIEGFLRHLLIGLTSSRTLQQSRRGQAEVLSREGNSGKARGRKWHQVAVRELTAHVAELKLE